MIEFFNTVVGLKYVPRKGWKQKANIEKTESVADHSYSMSVMAMVLADSIGLDTKKVLTMSLLHDLAESITGDFTPAEISKKEKIKLENKTIRRILSKLPPNLSSTYENTWMEYQDEKSKESVLVHEVDNLEMALQAKKYQKNGHAPDLLEGFFNTARNEIKSNESLKILDKIMAQE